MILVVVLIKYFELQVGCLVEVVVGLKVLNPIRIQIVVDRLCLSKQFPLVLQLHFLRNKAKGVGVVKLI